MMIINKKHFIDTVNKFKEQRVLVLGDLILDKFIVGTVSRISPEAPVPVVSVTDEKYTPGAAGNVAANLLKLGAKVSIVSVVGNDFYGSKLIEILKEKGADVSDILKIPDRPTSVKTRIIAEHQQVVRVDNEVQEEISAQINKLLINILPEKLKKTDSIIISDYGKGAITTSIIKSVLSYTSSRKIPVIVDPQVGHFFEYNNVSSITPNVKEAGEALKMVIKSDEELIEAGKKLLEKIGCETVLITRGREGMTLFHKSGWLKHIPTVAKEVYDVTGAGDTVAGVFTLGLASKLDWTDAATLANYAAAVAVGKLGTAVVSVEELICEINKGLRGCK